MVRLSFLLTAAFATLAAASAPLSRGTVSLDLDLRGAVCLALQKSGKKPAYIKLHVNTIAIDTDVGSSQPNDYKIPFLIFRYVDIANYTNIPDLYDYHENYPLEVPPQVEDGRFVLEFAPGHQETDPQRMVSEYLTWGDGVLEIKYEVPESGVYCVYIAPPRDAGLVELVVPVLYRSLSGYLPFTEYVVYSQLKYGVLIGAALFGYLVHSILKHRVGDDFKNLNNISIISKAVLFLGLAPQVVIMGINTLIFGFQNNFIPSAYHFWLFDCFKIALEWANSMFEIFRQFLILVFAMGYGVIYYHRGGSSNYRKFPSRLSTRALTLLVANGVTFSVYEVLNYFMDNYSHVMFDPSFDNLLLQISPHLHSGIIYLFYTVLEFLNQLFPLVWFVYTLVSYFKTKKVIAKFPPISLNHANSTEQNNKIITAYARSIIVIFVFPVVVGLLMMSVVISRYMKASEIDTFPDYEDDTPYRYSLWEIRQLETTAFDPWVLLPMIWVSFFSAYGVIVGLYAIWIKDNNGLIVDEGDGYEAAVGYEEPNFEVDDSDQE